MAVVIFFIASSRDKCFRGREDDGFLVVREEMEVRGGLREVERKCGNEGG